MASSSLLNLSFHIVVVMGVIVTARQDVLWLAILPNLMERILPVSLSSFLLNQTLPPSPIFGYNEAKWYFISPSNKENSKSPVLVTATLDKLRLSSLCMSACSSLMCFSL
jgi:hypothetical protein